MELDIPDGKGRFIYTHTVWGFCDGSQVYVMMDGNVFSLRLFRLDLRSGEIID